MKFQRQESSFSHTNLLTEFPSRKRTKEESPEKLNPFARSKANESKESVTGFVHSGNHSKWFQSLLQSPLVSFF